jgi:hypothetical protein
VTILQYRQFAELKGLLSQGMSFDLWPEAFTFGEFDGVVNDPGDYITNLSRCLLLLFHYTSLYLTHNSTVFSMFQID